MSIISEALKKAGEKRRQDVAILQEDVPDSSVSDEVREIASRKINWNILSGLGTFFIVGFAVVAFLYNTTFPPAAYPPKPNLQKAKIDLHQANVSPSPPPQQIVEVAVEKPPPIRIIDSRFYPTLVPEVKKKPPLPDLELCGIMEGIGEPMAIINNRIMKKGEYVEGAHLIAIGSDRVNLLYDDKEIILRLER